MFDQATQLAFDFMLDYSQKETEYKNAVNKAKKEFGDTKIADLYMQDYKVGDKIERMVGGVVDPSYAYTNIGAIPNDLATKYGNYRASVLEKLHEHGYK